MTSALDGRSTREGDLVQQSEPVTSVLLGCIADDLTGATDLAGMLVAGGMRVIQTVGIPASDLPLADVDAVVVALKTRTAPSHDAVRLSVEACEWLRRCGARRFYFKYSSTFDSTDQGNIGPVADALMDALETTLTIACPAFPENGRTVYLGHLFVRDKLLSESGMEHHPLTPMTDPNLVRVLQRQARRRVGFVPYPVVQRGSAAIVARFEQLQVDGCALVVIDAIQEDDLLRIAEACGDLPLVTGSSGLTVGLTAAYRRRRLILAERTVPPRPDVTGLEAVVAGSCSQQTRCQVERMKAACPALEIDVPGLLAGADVVQGVLTWCRKRLPSGPLLVYSSAPPERVLEIQGRFGRQQAGRRIEQALAQIARGLVDMGVRRLIVAGGETSGAVIDALGVQALRIGPQIDPGVPWTETVNPPQLALALKSGNFGSDDFFLKALQMLQ